MDSSVSAAFSEKHKSLDSHATSLHDGEIFNATAVHVQSKWTKTDQLAKETV